MAIETEDLLQMRAAGLLIYEGATGDSVPTIEEAKKLAGAIVVLADEVINLQVEVTRLKKFEPSSIIVAPGC